MNIYLIVILAILIFDYLLNSAAEVLNLCQKRSALPKEFDGYHDAQRYEKSQQYLKERTRFLVFQDTLFNAAIVAFILLAGFNFVDRFARSFGFGQIITGLIFAGTLILALQIISLPFSLYNTFVIEEKYGFNRTTPKTFFLDIVKELILGILVGGAAFSLVIWFFGLYGRFAWIYCWIAVTAIHLFLMFIAPVLILPLFNKFTPLEKVELKQAIQDYAKREHFKIKGIFTMDASRRSLKTNAFFIGFGNFRRIVLFDTLVAKNALGELLSILAHEMGHYKKHHIIKMLAISILINGFMFYLLSLLLGNAGLFSAFGMENISVYASIFFFGFLYTPMNMLFLIFSRWFSRRNEYEADAYAVLTYCHAEDFISALKKLAVDNLSNLNPHPLKIFLDYTHPPVLERIKKIRALQKAS